ncbi:MAG: UDP-3-O-(3-hydroxymyristoyl)glucosamine N-acyltransferase, partial [Candidatus Calescibacterium sp.]
VVFPNAVIYPFTEIGDNSIIHAGAVIGADGFGYISYFGDILKIPQVGKVKIGSRVEIGANSCVDRATMGQTEIGDDVKIDNLVQIAHNVKIGKGTRIAALCGVAGSSKIGEYCVFGGQVGVVDHVSVGDFSIVAARAAIISDVEGGKVIMGEPAMDRAKFLKIHALYLKLPEIYEKIKKLESEVEELKKLKGERENK